MITYIVLIHTYNRMHPSNCYSRSLRAVRHRPTGNKPQCPLPKRSHQTTDRPATQPPSPPAAKGRLHSRNSFVSTSQHLLCKPAEARVAKWQEQWEATQSNLMTYDVHPKEQLPSGHTLPWRTWLPLRQRSICGATGRAKPVCAAWPHVISATL